MSYCKFSSVLTFGKFSKTLKILLRPWTSGFGISTCNILQPTATYCHTLQHTATHSNTLQHSATYCNTLQHTATHHENSLTALDVGIGTSDMQHTATHCNTLQHTSRIASRPLTSGLGTSTCRSKRPGRVSA